jgi:hypothetical protein
MKYKIVGADGKIYGPVSAEQIRAWIAAGRAESRTPVFVEGAADWTFVGLLPEFAIHLPASPTTIGPVSQPRIKNSLATAGLICGIISLICCCGCPFNLLGLIFSIIALTQIHAHPEQEGRGFAIAGLVCSGVSLLANLGMGLLQILLNPSHLVWHINQFQ